MATIDKINVCEQVEQLKHQFEQVHATGKVNDETQAVMNSLLLIVELILSIFLEKKTRKNNRNSCIPSSQTDKDSTALPTSKSKGKGKRVSGEVSNTRMVETVTISKAATCTGCGNSLTGITCHQHERRTRIDIVFEKVAEHVDAEIKQCPNCKSTVKGEFPEDMAGKLQYGNGLTAFAIHLIVSQMVALNRVQKQIVVMIGSVVAEATLLKFVLRLFCH